MDRVRIPVLGTAAAHVAQQGTVAGQVVGGQQGAGLVAGGPQGAGVVVGRSGDARSGAHLAVAPPGDAGVALPLHCVSLSAGILLHQ